MAATQEQEDNLHIGFEHIAGPQEAQGPECSYIATPQQWDETLQFSPLDNAGTLDEYTLDRILDSLPEEAYEDGLGEINLSAVIYACTQAIGGGSVTSISLGGYGASHVVFRVQFLDGQSVIFRAPFLGARHPDAMENEVATMEYLRRRKHCPTAQVYAWFPTEDNPTCVPYIIMEDMRGESLRAVWKRLTTMGQKARMMIKLAEYYARVTSPVPYDMCGALFFSQALKDGTVTSLDTDEAYEVGPFILQRRESINPDFITGAWPTEPARDMRGWWRNILSIDFAAMQRCWETGKESGLVNSEEQVSWSEVKRAGEALQRLVDTCPQSEPPYRIANFDYTFRHIYVAADGLRLQIVGCIDWQGAQVLPSMIVPMIPLDLYAELHGSLSLDRSRRPDFTTLLPSIKHQLDALPCGEFILRPRYEISMLAAQISKNLDVAEVGVVKTIYMEFYRLFSGREDAASNEPLRDLMERIHRIVCGGVAEWARHRRWLLNSQ